MLPAYGLWGYLAFARIRQAFATARLNRAILTTQLPKAKANTLLAEKLPKRPDGQLVWFHAPSNDDLAAFSELKLTLQDYVPDLEFLVTTEELENDFGEAMPDVIFQHLPLDYPRFMRRFVKNWKPDAGVWMSDTLYPCLMSRTAREGIPVVCANAGVTRKQRNRYGWVPSFAASYFKSFDRILVRSDEAARRLRWLRVPRRKLEVVGRLSAGAVALPYDEERRQQFISQLQNRTVWFSAHTEAAEIATLAKVQRRMSRSAQRVLLIMHLSADVSTRSSGQADQVLLHK